MKKQKRRVGVFIGEWVGEDMIDYSDNTSSNRYSFSKSLAQRFGLHQALVLSELIKLGAYEGPGGSGSIEVCDREWMESLPFLSLAEIFDAITDLVQQGVLSADVQFPEDSRKWNGLVSDDIDVWYCINSQYIFRKDGRDKDRSGYVYLLYDGEFYKIGYTARLGERQRELSPRSGRCPLMMGYMQVNDAPLIERLWHKMYWDKCANREWFHLDEVEAAFFLLLGEKGPFPLTTPVYSSLERFREPLSILKAEYWQRLEQTYQTL